MGANDRVLLENLLTQKNQSVAPSLSANKYFEYFVVDQVLKDYDLSPEEIEAGIVDGGSDGGLDAVYVFINSQLLAEDDDLSSLRKDVAIELVCIQAKNTDGFSEDAVDKLRGSVEKLLDLTIPLSTLGSTYNDALLRVIGGFRRAYQELASKLPSISVNYFYATKGSEVHDNVKKKIPKLEQAVRSLFSDSSFRFTFLNNSELVARARTKPKASRLLPTTLQPMQSKGAFVCLIKLVDLYSFIMDGDKLARHIFDSNVRDHQGRTEVNVEIQQTLEKRTEGGEEFWWLNNGITILGKNARYDGTGVMIEDPQIVNGVQTSTEIYNHFNGGKADTSDPRSILVRVIDPPTDASEDRIIKATNSQNAVAAASLRSTDKIHRDIEQYFRANGFFYDRRKNFYKNEGKPISKIVGIPYLAQSLMAMPIRRPDSARARPSSLLKNDDQYAKLFNDKYPLQLYLTCSLLMRRVDGFLTACLDVSHKEFTNIRFYVAMLATMELTGMPLPKPDRIAQIDISLLTIDLLRKCLDEAKGDYIRLGGSDQVAKGPDLFRSLINTRTTKFVEAKKSKVAKGGVRKVSP